jgi:hypothetical protein
MLRPRLLISVLAFARALGLAVVLIGGGPAAAWAAENVGETPAPEDAVTMETYRKAITDGVAEYDAGHFEEALSCFRRAHQLSPNARTFRGMGKAHFEMRNYVAAVRDLSAALKDERKPLSDEQRAEVQDLLDRSRSFVAIFTLTLSPPDVQIILDGEIPELQPDGTLMVGLGMHTIEVRAPGYQWRTMPLSVLGGERTPLALTLVPLAPPEPVAVPAPAPAPVAAPPAPEPAPAPEAAPEPAAETPKAIDTNPAVSSNRTAVMWFLGSGAAALLAGGAGIYWGVQNSNVNKCRNPESGDICTNESDLVWQRNTGGVVTIVAGAAAVTMATIGILSWKSAPAQPTQTSLACSVGPFGVTCGGAF